MQLLFHLSLLPKCCCLLKPIFGGLPSPQSYNSTFFSSVAMPLLIHRYEPSFTKCPGTGEACSIYTFHVFLALFSPPFSVTGSTAHLGLGFHLSRERIESAENYARPGHFALGAGQYRALQPSGGGELPFFCHHLDGVLLVKSGNRYIRGYRAPRFTFNLLLYIYRPLNDIQN